MTEGGKHESPVVVIDDTPSNNASIKSAPLVRRGNNIIKGGIRNAKTIMVIASTRLTEPG